MCSIGEWINRGGRMASLFAGGAVIGGILSGVIGVGLLIANSSADQNRQLREAWFREGAVAIASGQYTATLVENPDKTTRWVVTPAKEHP
jgi:gas vesicle protein